MSKGDTVVLAHRGECDGARFYEQVNSPFEAQRLVLLPLCAEKLLPERVVPPLRLSVAKAEKSLFVVPIAEGKFEEQCTPGWASPAPCARCVVERWREVLGGDPVWCGGPRLERLRVEEDVEGDAPELLEFVRRNRPRFSFKSSSPLAVPAVRFKFSGGVAALFLGRTLFVQSRRRALDPADIEAFAGVTAPEPPPAVLSAGKFESLSGEPAPLVSGTSVKPEEKAHQPVLDENALYEPEWVAAYLGIAQGTLSNWVSKKKMPHTRVGGKVRFLGKALREWLESQTNWPMDKNEPEASIDEFPWEKGRR